MKDKVLASVEEIIDYIKQSEDYRKYQTLKNHVYNNKEIMKIIDEVKALQKKAVKEEAMGKDTKKIDDEITTNLKALNNIPLYIEFTYIQEDLNNTYQTIKSIIEKYINSKTN